MLIKDKLSRISLNSLIPSKKIPAPVVFTEEPLSSSPFVMPQNRKIDAPFTGRVKELDLLRSLYRELISIKSSSGSSKGDHGKPLVIGVKGEAGIGKSRLITEFQKNIDASQHGKNFTYRAGCVSSGQEAYGLFRGFFSKSNFLKQAVTAERRTLIKNTISENILSLAREAGKNDLPLVIMLEDMQWADELSLAALDHFVSAVNLAAGEEDLMLFLLLNYRPSYRSGRVLRKECRLVEIELKGFSESESKQFISKLTGSKKISTNAVEQISRRSEGNPFNLEEICRSLNDGSKQIKIPATVKGLLVDKVSQLEKDERAVLIIASVLGRKFGLKLLNAILKKAGKPPAGADVLSRLEEKQYLVNLTSDIYEFRHDLLQEIVYRQLNKELRKNVHALAAGAIEEVYSANLSAHYYELARHYEVSGDEANTIKYFEKAGDKARDNYENERAERYYNKLLKLDNNIVNKVSIQLKLCDVYMNRDQWDKQIEICGQLLKKNRKLKSNFRIDCLKRIGYCFRLKGDYTQALKFYKKAMRIANANGDLRSKLDLMEHEAKVMLAKGNFKEAENLFLLIFRLSKKSNLKTSFRNALVGIGITHNKLGNFTEAIKFNDLLYEWAVSEHDNKAALTAQINKSESLYYMGKLEEAFRLYKISLQKSLKIHSHSDESTCLGNLGLIYYSKKQFSRAISLFKKQIKRLTLLGDKGGLARTLGNLGACYLSINKYQKAQSLFFLQSSKLKGLGKRYSEAICLANIAIVNSLQGDFVKSSFYIQKQIKIAGKILNQEGLFRAYTNLGINSLNLRNLNSAGRNFRKAILIADRNKLMLNLELTQLYYAETLYQLSRFSDAIRYSLLASSNAKRTNNKLISIYSECIYNKSKICTELGISSNVTSTATVAVPEFLNKMKYLLYSCTKPEEKAVVCYEIFVVIKVCRKYKVEVPDTLSYIEQAINHYSKILHKYESFKSLLRLKELKTELLNLRRKNETQEC